MKKGMKLMGLAAAVALVVALVQPGRITAAQSERTMRLWYDEPASKTAPSGSNLNGIWQSGTLPIGNGKLGANVYGEVKSDQLTLNEETFWSGGNYSDGHKGGNIGSSDENWEAMANNLLNGSTIDTKDIQGDGSGNMGYLNGYQPLANLYFSYDTEDQVPGDYVRELNLETALAKVSFGDNTRTYFVSHPDNVLAARLEGKNLGVGLSLKLSQLSDVTLATVSGETGYIVCDGTLTDNGLHYSIHMAVQTDGALTSNGASLTVSGASRVTVLLAAATDYSKDFYNADKTQDYYYRTGESASELSARVRGVLDAALAKGYDRILADHLADYKALYDRVSVDLGGSSSGKTTDALVKGYSSASESEKRYLETLEYQFGRYLLIAASREDSQLPTNLQGIWNDNKTANWYSDIHTNINLQMNYWLAGPSNLVQCLKPLNEYMEAMYEPGNRTVQAYTSATSGMMMHTQNNPFGYTAPGWDYSWGWSPSASTWLLQNCFDYYEYTGDTDYLRNHLYPLMEKQVQMYEQLLKEKNGKLVFPLSISPEIGGLTYGNTYEQSLIWQLYTDTIEAAKALGKDTAALEATRAKLYTDFIGTTGLRTGNRNGVARGSSYIKEWYGESDYVNSNNSSDTKHRHISQLLGSFPGTMLGQISGDYETDRTAAVNTLKLRGENLVSGWSLAQRACTWATLGDGANAYTYLSTVLTSGVMENLWGYHALSGSKYGGQDRGFQIDANYGYSAAFGLMLLQSGSGYIDPLPALPDSWSEGSFSGLMAEGNFAVSAAWSGGKATGLTITSNNGGECAVKVDWDQVNVTCEGKTQRLTPKDGILTFQTEAGKTYVLAEGTAPELNLKAVRNPDGTVSLTWDAQPGVTYTVSRKER